MNGCSAADSFSGGVCVQGTVENQETTATGWTWTCAGAYGGNDASCSETNCLGLPANGRCGNIASSQCSGSLTETSPGLCTAGSATGVAPTADGWSWTCTTGEGTDATCGCKVPPLFSVQVPPIKAEQDFGAYNNQLMLELASVASNEAQDLANSDLCYGGVMDALAISEKNDWGGLALSKLAGGLIRASIGGITTGNVLADYLIKFASEVIASTVEGNRFEDAIMRFVLEDTLGYVVGRVANDYMLGKSIQVLNKAAVEELLKEDGVVAWDLKGSNTNKGYWPYTKIQGQAFYNPYTHYMSVYVGANCEKQEEFYILQYEVIRTEYNAAERTGPLRVCTLEPSGLQCIER